MGIKFEFESGAPQFRIKESFDTNAPEYIYYGQPEIENDLIGIEMNASEKKRVKTEDTVKQVKANDILFSLISGKTSLVRKVHEGYLFTQNYVKIIPPKEVDVKYLIYILNENKSIKQQFQSGIQGSVILKYTVKQLKELKFPVFPNIEKQKLIGELYFNQLRLKALKVRTAQLTETKILKQLEEVEKHD